MSFYIALILGFVAGYYLGFLRGEIYQLGKCIEELDTILKSPDDPA